MFKTFTIDRSKKFLSIFLLFMFLSALVILNVFVFNSSALGISATILLIVTSIVLLSSYLRGSYGQRLLDAAIFLLAPPILFAIGTVFFWTFSDVVVIASIVWIVGYTCFYFFTRLPLHSIFPNDMSPTERVLRANKVYIWLSMFLVGIAAQIVILMLMRGEHVFHGFLSSPHTTIYSFALLLSILSVFYILLSSLHPLIKWISIILLAVTLSLTISIVLPFLYGADSWRHLAIETFILNGNTYEPTSLHELLKFTSEKIPNGAYYSLITLIQSFTRVDVFFVHKFISAILFVPLVLFVIWNITKLFFEEKGQAFFSTLFIIGSAGFLYLSRISSPQTFGVLFLFIAIYYWGRIAKGDNPPHPLSLILISVISILSYPVTGILTVLVIVMSLLIRISKSTSLNLFLGSFFAVMWAIVFFTLDIVVKKLPHKLEGAYSLFVIMGQGFWDWIYSFFPLFNSEPTILLALFILFSFGLWKAYTSSKELFYVLFPVLLTLLFIRWSTEIFEEGVFPLFTARTDNLLSILLGFIASFGAYFIYKQIFKKRSFVFILGLGIALLFAVTAHFNVIFFGWSASPKNVQVLREIISSNVEAPYAYAVLTDEVVAAAGSGLTGLGSGFYWYPESEIYDYYLRFIQDPKAEVLQSFCRERDLNQIYIYLTPIPPSNTASQKIQATEGLMYQDSLSTSDSRLYSYECVK